MLKFCCACEPTHVCVEARGGVVCVLLYHSSYYSLEVGSLTEVGAKLKLVAAAILLFLTPSASVTSVCGYIWLFILALGIETQVSMLTHQELLPIEPSLPPSKNCLKINL